MEPNYDPRRQRRAQAENDRRNEMSAWKIAGGVFLGLSLFYGVYRIHVAMEQRAALAEFNRAMAELSKPDADPMGWRAAARREASRRAAERALNPGERCIDGQRFERVENGWRQLNRPC